MDEDRPGHSPDEAADPGGQRDIASTRRDASSTRRDGSSTRRDESSNQRDGLSSGRDESSLGRDESALQRDATSTRRDRVADCHDEEADRLDISDDLADRHTLRVEELRGRGRSGRIRAAEDRARSRADRKRSGSDRDHAVDDRAQSGDDRRHALHDREHSSTDRAAAGSDRDEALHDREHAEDDRGDAEYDRRNAGIDELTGARRRGVGLRNLADEVRRAHREGHDHLVVAYVDVDGLKSVNDGQGHPAGDKILRAVASAFKSEMRSYDLLVRLGGDEFLGVLPNVGLKAARERFGRVRSELARSGHAISIGYAELRRGDSADDLVDRADAALLTVRARPRR